MRAAAVRRMATLAAAVAGVGSCSVDPTAAHGAPGLAIVAGAAVSDTAWAVLVQALIVELRDNAGAPVVGARLRFEATPVVDEPSVPSLYVGPVLGFYSYPFVMESTDASGRAAVRVVLGGRAGAAGVAISVLDPAIQDTAWYDVTPASPVAVAAEPADTAIFVGGQYDLRAAVVDQFGNPRREPVRLEAGSTAVAVSAGGRVTGQTIDRAFALARYGGLVDTAWVSVVPSGTIAAVQECGAYDGSALVTFNLDGSGRRTRVPRTANVCLFAPAWSPSGADIVYDRGSLLYAVDGSGVVRRIIAPGSGLNEEIYPRFSPDGAWIYFAARQGSQDASLWRVRPDGSGAGQVGPAVLWYDLDTHPDPSPDGTRLAFITNRPDFSNLWLRVLDLATSVVSPLDVRALYPRWSPDGAWIAYISQGTVKAIRPDGTGERQVSPQGDVYDRGLDWSSDGRWLISKNVSAERLELIEFAGGRVLPLAFTAFLLQPAWHR